MNSTKNTKPKKKQSLSLLQITGSILASMFGVQSDKNRARDEQYGKPIHFILGGIIFVVFFVLMLLLITHYLILE